MNKKNTAKKNEVKYIGIDNNSDIQQNRTSHTIRETTKKETSFCVLLLCTENISRVDITQRIVVVVVFVILRLRLAGVCVVYFGCYFFFFAKNIWNFVELGRKNGASVVGFSPNGFVQ